LWSLRVWTRRNWQTTFNVMLTLPDCFEQLTILSVPEATPMQVAANLASSRKQLANAHGGRSVRKCADRLE
jgi:hypothetical protein